MKKLFRETGSFLKKHLTTLKVLFVLAVLVFVIFEVGRISQDLNGEQMRASLATQSPVSLLILLVVGLIAVTPMLTYDFVITELLPGHYKPAYVIKSGWIVNTFTNIAGYWVLVCGQTFTMKKRLKSRCYLRFQKSRCFCWLGCRFGP